MYGTCIYVYTYIYSVYTTDTRRTILLFAVVIVRLFVPMTTASGRPSSARETATGRAAGLRTVVVGKCKLRPTERRGSKLRPTIFQVTISTL